MKRIMLVDKLILLRNTQKQSSLLYGLSFFGFTCIIFFRRDLFLSYQELIGKEIVNITDGKRLGILGQTDLELNTKTGQIKEFIIPSYSIFGLKRDQTQVRINWDQIEKVGKDTIIIRGTEDY